MFCHPGADTSQNSYYTYKRRFRAKVLMLKYRTRFPLTGGAAKDIIDQIESTQWGGVPLFFLTDETVDATTATKTTNYL